MFRKEILIQECLNCRSKENIHLYLKINEEKYKKVGIATKFIKEVSENNNISNEETEESEMEENEMEGNVNEENENENRLFTIFMNRVIRREAEYLDILASQGVEINLLSAEERLRILGDVADELIAEEHQPQF